MLAAVDVVGRYTVAFRLKRAVGVVPDQPGDGHRARPAPARRQRGSPIGSGPYRLAGVRARRPRHARAVRRRLPAARRRTAGSVFKVVPDETMRGLELRKGTVDLVVNDLSPDIVHGARTRAEPARRRPAPGTDYAYLGLQPARSAAARPRGCARPSATPSIAAPSSRTCAAAWRAGDRHRAVDVLGLRRATCFRFTARSRSAHARCSTKPDFRDPDGDGPAPRLRLTLKTSTAEAYRVQAAVIQQQLARGRHRARDSLVRVRDAVGRRRPRQRAALHAAVSSASPIPTCCGARFTRRRCRRTASIAATTRIPKSIG